MKKLTILHNNDIHGDILPEKIGESGSKEVGGIALLSGYINKVREEEENVLFVIAGDMLQGSIIDTEFKGISTIEIINYLSPDIVTLGNHEFDYGVPHLLFLERVANFPIVNANLYIKNHHRRLMHPYYVMKKAGMSILFTGIITEKVIDALKTDNLIGSFISIEEAATEVGRICNAYKHDDIDLTVLLTHIGFESDCELAKHLDPDWGVDIIIGGHSHTVLEKPEKIGNVLITQSGSGTNNIGRLDLTIDETTNSVVDYEWKFVAIDNTVAKPDTKLIEFIDSYRKPVDQKYNTIITKFSEKAVHPKREIETPLGDLFADIIADNAPSIIAFIGSGSIRSQELGPVVTLMDLMACFPYDDSIIRYEIPGSKLLTMFKMFMRNENRNGEGECYQVNKTVNAIYDTKADSLVTLKINDEPVDTTQFYSICLQRYHSENAATYLGITKEELEESGKTKVVSTSARDVIEEYFRDNPNLIIQPGKRLIYL